MGEVIGDRERVLYIDDEVAGGPEMPHWRSLIGVGARTAEVYEFEDGTFVLEDGEGRLLAIDMAMPLRGGAPSEDVLFMLRALLPEDEISLLLEGVGRATSRN